MNKSRNPKEPRMSKLRRVLQDIVRIDGFSVDAKACLNEKTDQPFEYDSSLIDTKAHGETKDHS